MGLNLTFALIVASAFIPGIVWLFFFLKEDIHPEPKKMLAKVFGIGMIMSLPILLIQIFSQSIFGQIGVPIFLTILLFSFTEEFFKFLAAWLGVSKSKFFDEPIDAMIYTVVAAIGLATIENFFILTNSVELLTKGLGGVSEVMIIRFVGATFLHIISSGIVGYYWAKSKLLKKNKKSLIALGIFLATVIHAAFNNLIIIFESQDFLIYPSLFLIFASIFLFKDFNELRKESIIMEETNDQRKFK